MRFNAVLMNMKSYTFNADWERKRGGTSASHWGASASALVSLQASEFIANYTGHEYHKTPAINQADPMAAEWRHTALMTFRSDRVHCTHDYALAYVTRRRRRITSQ